ncbi:translocation/assembly module TamB [Candidatus Fermentibacteria bacterium]|nr:translocation/assembly module TamB [Candidatus Fermentibacteria bacterium]
MTTTRRGRFRRSAVIAVTTLLGLVLVLMLSLLLPWVRVGLSRVAMDRLQASVPGVISVHRLTWPSPGHLRLEGVSWVSEGDTLLACDYLEIRAHLPALIRRDVSVHELLIGSLRGNLQAIPVSSSQDTSKAQAPFPRPGAIGVIPSIGVNSFDITVTGLSVSDSVVIHEAQCAGSFDNRYGRDPRLVLRELRVRAGPGLVDTDGAVEIDTGRGIYRGSLAVRVHEEWRMLVDVASTGADSLRLSVIRAMKDPSAEPYGLWLACAFQRDGRLIQGIGFQGHAITPGSDDLIPAGEGASAFPHLPRTHALVDGSVTWREGVDAHMRIEAQPNDVIRQGSLRLRAERGKITLDTLDVALPGIRIDAGGHLVESLLHGRGRISLIDASETAVWLDSPALEALAFAGLSLSADGPISSPALHGRLSAGGGSGGMQVDSLVLDLATPALLAEPVVFTLHGLGTGHYLRARGHIDVDGDTVTARLEPIHLATTEADSTTLERDGAIDFDLNGKALHLAGVRLVGDEGNIALAGSIGPGTENSLKARAEWPRLPAIVAAGSKPHDAVRVAAAWKEGAPFFIEIQADFAPDRPVVHRIHGTMRLPGPAQCAAFGPEARLADLGPIEGEFSALVDSLSRIAGHARLAAAGWIDSAVAQFCVDGHLVTVDTVDVAFFLGRMGGSGTVGPSQSRAELSASFDHLAALRGVLPSLPPDFDGGLTARARYEFDEGDWKLHATTFGSVGAGGIVAPSVEAEASWWPGGLEVALRAPQGLQGMALELTDIRAHYAADGGPAPLPGTLTLRAEGDGMGAMTRLTVPVLDEILRIQVDSLGLWHKGEALEASAPFTVSYDPVHTRLRIDGLSMTGEFGSLRADGTLSPDGSDFAAQLSARLPPDAHTLPIPPELQGAKIEARLQGVGVDTLVATWRVSDMTLPAGATTAWGVAHAGREGIAANLSVSDSSGRVALTGVMTAPLRIALWPVAILWADGPIHAEVAAESLVIPLGGSLAAGPPAVFHGTMVVGGTMAAPRGELDGLLSLPGHKKEPARKLILRGSLTPNSLGTEADRVVGRAAWTVGSVDVMLLAVAGRDTLVTATGQTALHHSVAAPYILWPDTSEVNLTLRAPRFPLNMSDGYLPDRTKLKGTCAVDLQLSGPAALPALKGSVTARQAEVSLPNGSRVTADIDLIIGGSLAKPSARGEVSVLNGVIMLPEAPRVVHDVEGEAMLWSLPSAPFGSAPQYAHRAPKGRGVSGSPPPVIEPDVDIELSVPGGLWVRGQGLNIEVAGELRLAYTTAPVITGTLRTVQGRLDYLGRTFTLERGSLVFYGKHPPDPVLDILVRSRVADATFQIAMSGTLSEPEIELSSEPELPEAEIVSYLILGRPTDQLSSGQVDLIRERLTQIASLRGVGELQAMVSKTLGLDLVKFGEGQASGSADALTVGKYLSPRLLVGYERDLSGDSPTYLTLEYLISEILRLKTWVGDSGDSSVEISLTKDY